MQLPEHVYRTLVEVCDAYPWPTVQQDEHLGEILNEVAWRHRAEGWGLSRKRGGRYVESPVGPIAEDILQLPDGNHFDVLGAAAVGNPLKPGRANSIGIINLRDRPWVAPVQHTPSWLASPAPPPPSEPAPPVGVHPTPPPSSCECNVTKEDIAGVYEVVLKLASQVQAASGRNEELVVEMVGHMDDIKLRIERVSQELANKNVGCRVPGWLR